MIYIIIRYRQPIKTVKYPCFSRNINSYCAICFCFIGRIRNGKAQKASYFCAKRPPPDTISAFRYFLQYVLYVWTIRAMSIRKKTLILISNPQPFSALKRKYIHPFMSFTRLCPLPFWSVMAPEFSQFLPTYEPPNSGNFFLA